jgi:hypothetical protein
MVMLLRLRRLRAFYWLEAENGTDIEEKMGGAALKSGGRAPSAAARKLSPPEIVCFMLLILGQGYCTGLWWLAKAEAGGEPIACLGL